MSRSPTLAEIFDAAIARTLRSVRVSLPARVESYDAATQTISAKPLLQDVHEAEDESLVPVSLPVVNRIPVVFPGAGGFRVTFPIKAGDTVLLLIGDRSLDIWKSKGGEVDPVDVRRHELTDAIAIVGLNDLAHALATAPTDRLSLGADAPAGPRVEVTADEILLDGGTKAIGRVGDSVSVTIPAGTVITTNAPSAGSPITVAADITVSGSITSGAPRSKA